MTQAQAQAQTFIAVLFYGSNTYTRSDHHGNPIQFGLSEAQTPHFKGILWNNDDIDAAEDDTWYAMDAELFSSVFGQDLQP